jgi:CRP/FNR family transcriptional regulator, nitrogen fixation regulation protein
MQGTAQTMVGRSGDTSPGTLSRGPANHGFARPARRDALDLLEQFGTTVAMEREQEIHGQGQEACSCYRVLSGCVRLVKLMEDGRRQIGEFLMAGDLLGFDALDTHDFAAEAVSDVVLRRYPRRMVEALADSNGHLARRLRDFTSVSLRTAHTRLLLLGRKTASEKIATFLLEMAERLPHRRVRVLDLPMSRTDMADHLGLTIETVCRVLAHLRRDGTIAIERGSIEIRNVEALRQMASEPRH